MTGNSASTGIPSATHSSATAIKLSTETRSTPGIEATCWRWFSPSRMKTG